jgi:hypothetical protein
MYESKENEDGGDSYPLVLVDHTQYYMENFDATMLSEIVSALHLPMDRNIFRATERAPDNGRDDELTEAYIKKFIMRFIFKYAIPEDRDDRVTNALQFFNAYLKGAFIPFRKDVIVISGPGKHKVWEYEDSMAGELELLSRLTMEEQTGTFALPGRGFWRTNLEMEYNDDTYKMPEGLRRRGIFLSASANLPYEVDNAFV